MRLYVIAQTTHFESQHSLDVSGERKSLDGAQCVIEIDPEPDLQHIGCTECTCYNHNGVLEVLNAPESSGVWY